MTIPPQEETLRHHLTLQHKDVMAMVAKAGVGEDCVNYMIPTLVAELQTSDEGDIYEASLRTCDRLKMEMPEITPELQSTLTQRLCLSTVFKL